VEEMDMSRNSGTALDATFIANADAPRAARVAVADLNGDLDDELVFRLKMLVSEAVTNRVLDQALGGGHGRVHLEFSSDDHGLRGTVSDLEFEDDRPPGSASAATRDLEAGMMAAFSDSWGTAHFNGDEIAIWFEVIRGPAPTQEEYGKRFTAAVAAWSDRIH
jgi:anti-sigma regulatory factor (Ser/Thr protein kinase)